MVGRREIVTTLQKVVVGLLGIGLATTLLMKDRQTVPVIGAVGKLGRDWLGTAMGTLRGNG
jgi:hypothetical protein